MDTIAIATPFNVLVDFKIASPFKRLLAYWIDLFILFAYLFGMLYLLYGKLNIRESGIGFSLIIIMLPLLLYNLLSEIWLNGQSLGKKILQIRVISLDGGSPTVTQYLLRWFLRFYEWGFVVFCVFWLNVITGFWLLIFGGIATLIIIATTRKNQRLGDVVANTVMIDTKNRLSVNDTIFMQTTQTRYTVTFPEVMRLSDKDINTIKSVITHTIKTNNYDSCNRIAEKIKNVLGVQSSLFNIDFLEKLMADYNYLATKE